MSTSKVTRLVCKYELGRKIGEGTFAKVKFAKNSETGEPVAIKILDKEKVLKHKMAEQIKREISTMKLIKHPYAVQLYEVMGSKTKIFIVLEFVTGGELFEKVLNHGRMKEEEARKYFQQLICAIDYCHSRGVYHRDLKPENLLLDVCGNLKISDFGLSAHSQQVKEDGMLHTTCGTPNYVAPEVLKDRGYDGVYLSSLNLFWGFEINNSESWIPILQLKGFKRPVFQEKEDIYLDDVEAVFKGPEGNPINQIREKKEEHPVTMNAFEIISLSRGLNLGNLFGVEQEIRRETRFTSKCPANEIICKIEAAAKPLGFDVHKNNYKMDLENVNAGRKGKLKVSTEVFQMAPSLHMVEVRKAKGDTLEFIK
ncbi:hypothetical protein MKX01_038484, partial [Papaver californicum]